MISDLGAHVLRRGVAHVSTRYIQKRDEPITVEVPTWGYAVIAVTFLFFAFLLISVEYTLEDVIATLAMVEQPSAAITVSPADAEEDTPEKEGLLESSAPTITLVRQKPITSKIRTTLRHLKAQGGRRARMRGFLGLCIYAFVLNLTTNLFEQIVPPVPGRLLVITAVAGALCSTIHAAWTHTVISMPSGKRFHKRFGFVSASAWKQLWLPGAVKASSVYVASYLCTGFIQLLQLDRAPETHPAAWTHKDWCSFGLRVLGVILFAIWTGLFIILPATVTQVRVEASMLPEDDEVIVPFDRTFGGKVVPKILGGTGCLGFVDAWRTFDWEARRRLIKLYIKTFMIVVTLMVIMVHVIALEFWAIMGPALGKALAAAKNGQL